MSEAPETTDAPANSADATNTPPADAAAPANGKAYSEAELNAIIAARVSKHEKSLRKTWEQEQAEAKRKAEQTLEEKYAELERQYQTKAEEVEAAKRDANDRIALAGKVTDLDYATWKANQDPKYRDDKGALKIDALLADHPALNAQRPPKPGPHPTPAGGEPDFGRTGMNQLIRTRAGRT